MDDLGALLDLARRVATDAAALLVEGLQHARVEVSTKSSSTDMVTEMDRRSERLIVAGIRAERPDDAVVGEEGSDTAGTSDVRWLVDPIDGTTNYLYGYPGFAVSVAAEVAGHPAVGVVVDPLHGDEFTAVRGGGARRNGTAIRASTKDDLGTALVATGFAYARERRRLQAGVLTRVLPEVRDLRRGGAASVDLCWVACGRIDAFYERGLAPWDFAAGALIAAEAGARVGDLDGGPPSSAFTLAAPPALFVPLRDLLRRSGAATA